MKPHYFNQEKPDKDDFNLQMAIEQGWVPETCLLNGIVVVAQMNNSKDPCSGCNGPRNKCHGRPKESPEKKKPVNSGHVVALGIRGVSPYPSKLIILDEKKK